MNKNDKSLEIKVNPDVLKALRESSGYTVEEIAKKIKTTATKVQRAEKGIASFTLTQIKKWLIFITVPSLYFWTEKMGMGTFFAGSGQEIEIVYDS
jgi:transcriptional regulator with XRE-family HTH domain